jgi:hypothetical protein
LYLLICFSLIARMKSGSGEEPDGIDVFGRIAAIDQRRKFRIAPAAGGA